MCEARFPLMKESWKILQDLREIHLETHSLRQPRELSTLLTTLKFPGIAHVVLWWLAITLIKLKFAGKLKTFYCCKARRHKWLWHGYILNYIMGGGSCFLLHVDKRHLESVLLIHGKFFICWCFQTRLVLLAFLFRPFFNRWQSFLLSLPWCYFWAVIHW